MTLKTSCSRRNRLGASAVLVAILAATGVFGGDHAHAAPLASIAASPAADRMTVTVVGQGPDVILIPGLASSSAVWDATVKQLSATHRVHVVQVAGFAGAPVAGNADGAVVGPLVEAVDGYIKAKGLKSPAVIGHSLGGFTGLLLAQRHPGSIGRLMIVDSLPFFSLLFSPAATPEMVRPQAVQMRDATVAMSPEAFAGQQAMGAPRFVKSAEGQKQVIAWGGASSPSVVGRAMYDLLVTDARGDLAKVKAPTTLLYAYDTAMGMPSTAADRLFVDAYAGLPGLKATRIDDARHFIMLDQPQAFAQAVADFLK
ncbi:alpha/beta fold hydrolase [Caulobacter vibrioides]|nr:alpha/beta hydrolase [Caulobacter vibrioides]YP_002517686.1 alpha/beta hydrolase family protein [Caulobacter vibrioides NA1000]ACL95778.1 alpha/beta hydrolase family protein [Caulobacter vibrioides NA1000]ATC29094.1 alpha/beta hydrolase [Caulobacter vibrioides]QXZ50608.1 alpha/beta hydrolase [Caulobacter vibrioides]